MQAMPGTTHNMNLTQKWREKKEEEISKTRHSNCIAGRVGMKVKVQSHNHKFSRLGWAIKTCAFRVGHDRQAMQHWVSDAKHTNHVW